MDAQSTVLPGPREASPPGSVRKAWQSIRARLLGGLLFVLPLLLTFWLLHWLYTQLMTHVIDPLAQLVIWKVGGGRPDAELPPWFETYAAPLMAIALALLLLYVLGFFVHTRVRRAIDWLLQRVPVISTVYGGVQKLLQAFDKPGEQKQAKRVVLVEFPHPGTRVPAFVTSSLRDVETQKVILCVYVPTTPVPTSGYMLMVPEEDVIELTWTTEQALQTIISGGLTAPPQVRYFKPARGGHSDAGGPRLNQLDGRSP